MDVNKQFGRLSNGYKLPIVKSKTMGQLLLDGKPIVNPAPFAILNMMKSRDYAHVFPKSRLKIVSLTIKK